MKYEYTVDVIVAGMAKAYKYLADATNNDEPYAVNYWRHTIYCLDKLLQKTLVNDEIKRKDH